MVGSGGNLVLQITLYTSLKLRRQTTELPRSDFNHQVIRFTRHTLLTVQWWAIVRIENYGLKSFYMQELDDLMWSYNNGFKLATIPNSGIPHLFLNVGHTYHFLELLAAFSLKRLSQSPLKKFRAFLPMDVFLYPPSCITRVGSLILLIIFPFP